MAPLEHLVQELGFPRVLLLEAMRPASFWEAAETRRRLLSVLPEYRLSKFQRVLPERWQVEMVGAYLLDFEATARFLAGPSGTSPRGSRRG